MKCLHGVVLYAISSFLGAVDDSGGCFDATAAGDTGLGCLSKGDGCGDMGARGNGPDGFVSAVGGELWGCHKPDTGTAVGMWGAGGALNTLGLSLKKFPLFSCGIVVFIVVVVTEFPAGGGINDGGKAKGFGSKFGIGIANCSLIFRTLSIWASI